jgi:hypothetical protein
MRQEPYRKALIAFQTNLLRQVHQWEMPRMSAHWSELFFDPREFLLQLCPQELARLNPNIL